ncbi:MAG: DNA starvation/stationary phase protection protein [Acidobacteriota bacterium]
MASSKAQTQKKSEIVSLLQQQVANAVVIYLNYKHYHWQVYGPHFRDLHLLFDEFAKQTLETIDDFAERIRMIGEDPSSDPNQILKTTSVKVATQRQNLRAMIEEADQNTIKLIVEMREAGRLADDVGDIGTVDLFSRIVQVYEKQEWYLRDILKKDDQLS